MFLSNASNSTSKIKEILSSLTLPLQSGSRRNLRMA